MIREVIRFRDCTPLPGAPECLVGILNLRGTIIDVFDLRRFFGLPLIPPGESARVLILGLDGATFTVLEPFMQSGLMPNLAKLTQGGVRADLRSTMPPLTPPAWTTLMTGKRPGHHGVFDFFQKEAPGSEYYRLSTSNDIKTPTIWRSRMTKTDEMRNIQRDAARVLGRSIDSFGSAYWNLERSVYIFHLQVGCKRRCLLTNTSPQRRMDH